MNLITWTPGMTLADLEEAVIIRAYQHYGENKTATADGLGISVRSLRDKLIQYNYRSNKEETRNGRIEEPVNALPESAIKAIIQGGNEAKGGVHLESSTEISKEQGMLLRESEKVQELPSKLTSERNTKGRGKKK